MWQWLVWLHTKAQLLLKAPTAPRRHGFCLCRSSSRVELGKLACASVTLLYLVVASIHTPHRRTCGRRKSTCDHSALDYLCICNLYLVVETTAPSAAGRVCPPRLTRFLDGRHPAAGTRAFLPALLIYSTRPRRRWPRRSACRWRPTHELDALDGRRGA